MKQVFQNLKSGQICIEEVPVPRLSPGSVMVRVSVSLVSAGTERAMIDFAQKSLLAKARARPDLVRQVLDKARREGIVNALEAATRRLDQPQSLGYSCAGTVIATGEGVTQFNVGDRVACAGAGYANHAEVIVVPTNLVGKIPSVPAGVAEVSMEEAAFTTLGAIAIHGLRLAAPAFGDAIAVLGLGPIGILAVQLIKAAGCRAFGMDPNQDRCLMAERLGCDRAVTSEDDLESVIAAATGSVGGTDSVLIAASTSSSAPLQVAGRVVRPGARVVAIGAVGTDVPRKLYYEKELQFLISRSYGPGRYDSAYEEKGRDYPVQYVRWTENRNMQAFLDLLAQRKINPAALVTHRFRIEEANAAYELLSGEKPEPSLGILICYNHDAKLTRTIQLADLSRTPSNAVKLGVLGAGNFAASVLIPALRQTSRAELRAICTGQGTTARHLGKKFRFTYCTTDDKQLLDDSEINAVVVATRHDSHARQVMAALDAGKNVFCEKPLCIAERELEQIVAAVARSQRTEQHPLLMVGYNRRFAPMVRRLQHFLSTVNEPLLITCRVNAGYIPSDNWVQDPDCGGGRIIGELCHFVDLVQFLVGAPSSRAYARVLPNGGRYCNDNVVVSLDFANGSVATLIYSANGDKNLGKERVEVFGGGTSAVLDDYRSLVLARRGRRETVRSRWKQDKGHRAECGEFIAAITEGRGSPTSLESILATSLTTFRVLDSIRTGAPVSIHFQDWLATASFPAHSSDPSSEMAAPAATLSAKDRNSV